MACGIRRGVLINFANVVTLFNFMLGGGAFAFHLGYEAWLCIVVAVAASCMAVYLGV